MARPSSPAASPAPVQHPPWTRQAALYEVNIRQYTPEGTLNAFAAHLPRLQAMGVDILWLMPIQPIGKRHRKGSLGSYYAVSDYTAVNPEFGTLEDLRALVNQAHDRGMKLILDWVANHTAWDHAWTTTHTDWYKLDTDGKIFPVTFNAGTPHVEYWTDVVALNYDKPALWTGMIEAMAFWVKAADIDGFRCDVAGLVPTPFWNEARRQLDAIKPMFMLAEWSEPDLHEQAFDMTYGWDLSTLMKQIAQGQATAQALRDWVHQLPGPFPPDAYRLRFTSNHDENSWHGTDAELYGPAWPVMAVLSFTLPGMPLIYGGQEAGLDKRLAFFERDTLDWRDLKHAAFFAGLLSLKHQHPVLANGEQGAPPVVLDVGNNDVFAFARSQPRDWVQVVANLSGVPQRFQLAGQEGVLPAWGWSLQTL
jgi:glycosidase